MLTAQPIKNVKKWALTTPGCKFPFYLRLSGAVVPVYLSTAAALFDVVVLDLRGSVLIVRE